MKSKKLCAVLALSCAVLLSGCGDSDKSEYNTTTAAVETTAEASTEIATEAVTTVEEVTEATPVEATEEAVKPVEPTMENAIDVSVKYFGAELLSEDEVLNYHMNDEGIPDEKIALETPMILDYLDENDKINSKARASLVQEAELTHDVKDGTTIYLSISNCFYEYKSADEAAEYRHKGDEYLTEEDGFKLVYDTEQFSVRTSDDTIIIYKGVFGDKIHFSGQIYYAPPIEDTEEWDKYNEGMKQFDNFFNSLGVENPVRLAINAK